MRERGASAVDAVEATVKVLEDNPLFNAGRGAVFAADGKNYLDASIMDTSRHVLFTGQGADQYAAEPGLEQVGPSFFRTEVRWQAYTKPHKE
ncbi:hypothetical protein ABAC402_12290 [Asticcacaulis sp. AC402]|nr:hypothetical protein ABAC402_12290 [Asticcacaulis sp. AC402]